MTALTTEVKQPKQDPKLVKFVEIYGRLTSVFGAGVDQAKESIRMQEHYNALSDLSIESLEYAKNYIVKHNQFFPKPREIREIANTWRNPKMLRLASAPPRMSEEEMERGKAQLEKIKRMFGGDNGNK